MVSVPGVGRALVATRDIAAGELVFEERPLTVGPLHDTPPVCLGCFGKVSGYLEDNHTESLKRCTEIGKKAWLFAELQPGRARKRINAT